LELLIIGLAMFIGIHLLPSFVNIRQNLINKLGEMPYKGAYAAIALTGLVLIVIGHRKADFIFVKNTPPWGFEMTNLLMPLVFILFSAVYLPGNIKRFTRHPMLWGTILWSILHLLSNGDLASIIIFASIGIFALFNMYSFNRRGAKLQQQKLSFYKDVVVVVVGFVTYVVVLQFHPA